MDRGLTVGKIAKQPVSAACNSTLTILTPVADQDRWIFLVVPARNKIDATVHHA